MVGGGEDCCASFAAREIPPWPLSMALFGYEAGIGPELAFSGVTQGFAGDAYSSGRSGNTDRWYSVELVVSSDAERLHLSP